MTNYNCPQKEKLQVTVEDIKCFQCKKKFLTQNLFEWHGCFLKTKGNCNKCGLYISRKKMLFKHYVLCEGKFHSPELELINKGVKSEFGANAVVGPGKTGKGPKKKTVPNRKMSTRPDIVKKEIDLNPTEEEDEYANYEEDITYDNFGNDSDSNDVPGGLEPEVRLEEKQTVKIKQERLSDPPTIEQKSNQLAPELIRNIKLEKSSVSATVVTTNNWKLKIKTEKGTNQASTQLLNPLALGSNKSVPAQKTVFKIPQGLAMKIKLEKKDAGYGDVVEERDEAEPEDEDLLGDTFDEPAVKIKTEKFDPGYGDSQSLAPAKQLINPMALMREKASSNGLPEKSLVISAVTSINSDSPGETGVGNEAMTQNDIASNAHETSETNDVPAVAVVVAEKPRENLMMVQIPRELVENLENHSSPSVECVESSLAAGGASESNCHEAEATVLPPSNDDLDSLLKKYEDAPPADNNDLFNDLLKFD